MAAALTLNKQKCMLSINQIKKQYPQQLQSRPRFLLSEYLQYKILEALAGQDLGNKLVFMDGTAIRLIHHSQRFSEDLDFDNQGLDKEEFNKLVAKIQRQLELEGLAVEIKKSFKGAYHCYFKFSDILQRFNLSKQKKEKILIRFDVVEQNYQYQPEVKLINQFDVFTQVKVVPIPLLLAQKILAALHRKQAKGRDFYDIVFLMSQTKPDMNYLQHKIGVAKANQLQQVLMDRCQELDFKKLAADVEPFLIKPADQQRVLHFEQFVQSQFASC